MDSSNCNVGKEVFYHFISPVNAANANTGHLRLGEGANPYGETVNSWIRTLLRRRCTRHQRVQVHCASTTAAQIAAWLKVFPRMHFSYGRMMAAFTAVQQAVLRIVPRDRSSYLRQCEVGLHSLQGTKRTGMDSPSCNGGKQVSHHFISAANANHGTIHTVKLENSY